MKINGIVMAMLLVVIMLTTGLFSTACSAQESREQASSHLREGLRLYREGLYDLAPEGKIKEAALKYEQALRELQKASALDETSVETRKTLAKLYYLLERYEDAAEEYRKVTELVPASVDNYAALATILAKINRYDAALVELEKARSRTDDPKVVDALDGLIGRLKEAAAGKR